VAFGGVLTFSKSAEVRDAASQAPVERILTETDAPFMAPHPLRGTICGPEHTIFTAALLSQLLAAASPDVPPSGGAESAPPTSAAQLQLLAQFHANAQRFFGL